jgi:hypothetical protein
MLVEFLNVVKCFIYIKVTMQVFISLNTPKIPKQLIVFICRHLSVLSGIYINLIVEEWRIFVKRVGYFCRHIFAPVVLFTEISPMDGQVTIQFALKMRYRRMKLW